MVINANCMMNEAKVHNDSNSRPSLSQILANLPVNFGVTTARTKLDNAASRAVKKDASFSFAAKTRMSDVSEQFNDEQLVCLCEQSSAMSATSNDSDFADSFGVITPRTTQIKLDEDYVVTKSAHKEDLTWDLSDPFEVHLKQLWEAKKNGSKVDYGFAL